MSLIQKVLWLTFLNVLSEWERRKHEIYIDIILACLKNTPTHFLTLVQKLCGIHSIILWKASIPVWQSEELGIMTYLCERKIYPFFILQIHLFCRCIFCLSSQPLLLATFLKIRKRKSTVIRKYILRFNIFNLVWGYKWKFQT